MILNSSTTCVDMNKCTSMIITGIRGTELESLFKQFYEQMIDDKKIIVQMIKELSSVTPIEIDGMDSSTRRATATSFSCLWSYDYIRFPKYCNPNHVVPYNMNGITYFTPNRCDKVSEKFMKEWRRKFKGFNGLPLRKFGIDIKPSCGYICFHWKPIMYKGKYGIDVSDGIKLYLPNIKDKQYEIEAV